MTSAPVIARNDVTKQSRLYRAIKQLPFLDCRVSQWLPRNDVGGTVALIMAGLSPSSVITGLAPVIQVPFRQFSFCRIPGSRPGMIMVRP